MTMKIACTDTEFHLSVSLMLGRGELEHKDKAKVLLD